MLKSVFSPPERTLWTLRTFRIVDALLMGTADDPLRHRHVPDTVRPQERRDLPSNLRIPADIEPILEPAL